MKELDEFLRLREQFGGETFITFDYGVTALLTCMPEDPRLREDYMRGVLASIETNLDILDATEAKADA